MDQVVVLMLRDIEAADQFRLHQLALDHHLGEVNEEIQYGEIALPHSEAECLHVEPVPGKHAHLVTPDRIGRWPASTHIGSVDDVVVHESGRMDQFHHRSQPDRSVAGFPASPGGQ